MLRRGFGIGTSVAGRKLEAEIGRGGMGVVYRARNGRLDRTEAVKVITDELARDRSFRERFLREAMISVAVEHPHVIPVYDADEAAGGNLFIAMRYVEDGQNLAGLISQHQRLEPRLAAQIISDIASALDAAHARGLVHRDVKPSNVLIVDQRSYHSYLTDFGLSKWVSSETMLSGTGSVIGTVDYMSPEQAEGREVDVRTDVYALGVSLFEALTGRVPFDNPTNESRLIAKVQEPPPMITQVASGIPSEFDAVLARALARDPSERYSSAGELGRAALAAAGGSSTISTRSEIRVGSVVADCLIEEVAGEGGMAIVYRATQQNLGRTVALKVMSPGLADRPEFRDRFEREWKIAAALEHPSVVPILWAGESQGRLFIVMRFVKGGTLRETLAARGRLEPEIAVEVLEQVSSALAAAHSRGLVHRDIKPGNVLIDEGTGRVFLTDFGLAKEVGDDDITDVGDRVMGTPRYLPPERHQGAKVNEVLGDIYSLGCLLWDMLGGTERPRLETVGVPQELQNVVSRAMSLDPLERFPSTLEMARAARAALVSDQAGASPPQATDESVLPAPRSGVAPVRRQPFEPVPLSSGLAERVTALCEAALGAGLTDDGAAAELEEIRSRLTEPLRMSIVGEPGSGRSAVVTSIVRRRLSEGPSFGDLADAISVSYGPQENVDSDGFDIRLPVDSLRTVSLLIGAGAEEAADAFLIVMPATAVEGASALPPPLDDPALAGRISAVNAAVVLTEHGLDRSESAVIATGLEEKLGPLVAGVTPFNDLVAEVSSTDVALGEDVALLGELAHSSTPDGLFSSSEALRGGATAISDLERASLLDRFGLAGLGCAFELARSGQLTGVSLRRRLREVSGSIELEQTIDGFHQRGDALRAGRALDGLEELSYRWPELAFLRDQVEALRLEPEMHLIDLIGAYQRCVVDEVEVPADLLLRLKVLITGRTPAQRFGVQDGEDAGDIRAAALDGFRAWKMYENAGNASPAGRRIARKVARSYEQYARERESVTR